MNSQSYFSSNQQTVGAPLVSDNNCFPSSHRTNPHYHLQHQQFNHRCGFGAGSELGTGTTTQHLQSIPTPAAAAAAAVVATTGVTLEGSEPDKSEASSTSKQTPQHLQQTQFGYPERPSYQQQHPRHHNLIQQQQQFQQPQQRPSLCHPLVPSQNPQQQQQQQQQQQRWYPGYSPRTHQGSAGQGFSIQGSSWMAQSTDRPAAASKFPDSPPDSGSEPYSPPNETRPTSESTGFNAKASSVNTMATVMPSHMFMDPRGTSLHPSHPTHANPYHPDQHQVLAHQQPTQPLPHPPGMALAFSKGPFGFYGPMEPMKLDGDVSQRLAVPPSMALDPHELQSPYHSGVHNANNQPPKKKKVPTATLR